MLVMLVTVRMVHLHLRRCSGRRHLAQLNADAGIPVYSYRFNHVPWVTVSLPFVQWVSHGSDVPYVFNSQVNRRVTNFVIDD